jgi:hypothetical protein
MFSLFPSGLTVVAVILIRVERQKGANQDCKNYYNCRPHGITRTSRLYSIGRAYSLEGVNVRFGPEADMMERSYDVCPRRARSSAQCYK